MSNKIVHIKILCSVYLVAKSSAKNKMSKFTCFSEEEETVIPNFPIYTRS